MASLINNNKIPLKRSNNSSFSVSYSKDIIIALLQNNHYKNDNTKELLQTILQDVETINKKLLKLMDQ